MVTFAITWIGGCFDARRSDGEDHMAKAFTIDMATAARLGSIVVHVEEYLSADGHPFDTEAIKALLAADDVQAFIDELRGFALVPEKRHVSVPAPASKTYQTIGSLRPHECRFGCDSEYAVNCNCAGKCDVHPKPAARATVARHASRAKR